MKHYGDITKIDGSKVEPVDVIVGGSPCQDLSVAGKRAGLDGERSGLFMEQIRITKEMRNESIRHLHGADEYIRPRFLVWENVPGAFSSNQGKDFQAVLTEIVRIVKADSPDVPLPKNGRWAKAGCLMGIGDNGQPFSVAYRLHDAQFWGVPQRRKRISLVADFGGQSAPEILFERESVSGDIEESREKGEGTAADTERSVDKAEPILLESNQNHATIQADGISTALPASMGMGGGYVPMITDKAISIGNGQLHDAMSPSIEVSKTLNCMDDPKVIIQDIRKSPGR